MPSCPCKNRSMSEHQVHLDIVQMRNVRNKKRGSPHCRDHTGVSSLRVKKREGEESVETTRATGIGSVVTL